MDCVYFMGSKESDMTERLSLLTLHIGTQRRSWRLQACLQGKLDKKASVPWIPQGPAWY